MIQGTQVAVPATAHNKRSLLKRAIRMIITLVLVYLLLCAMPLFGCADRILFQPHAAGYEDGPNILKLRTSDGLSISAVYVPNPSAKYTILYSHGNAEDMGDDGGEWEMLRQMGFAVFAYDYHGYGTSQGKPSEENCYRDIDAAYEYLTGTLRIPPERIILLGKSVGGGPSTDLASRKPVGGLVLQSAFISAFRVFRIGYVIPGDRFRNLEKMPQVRCPVLVMHGSNDLVVPFSHGPKLYDAATGAKQCLWVEGAGHNNLPHAAGERYAQAFAEFVTLLQKK